MRSSAQHPTESFDVVVIGGGVMGTSVAARLSATNVRVCLVEAENDLCEGASKGNAGNAISFYGEPGTEETELLNASNLVWEELCGRLGVPYRRIGAVMVATTAEEVERLAEVHDQVLACGVRARMLTTAQVHAAEPLVTDACLAGMELPDEGLIDPMRLTIGYGALAVANGVELVLGQPVIGVEHDEHGSVVITAQRRIRARYVVNAAGLHSDRISALAAGEELRNWPRRGQYAILDRAFGHRMSRIVFSTATPKTKGINVMPTTHGSVLLGPTAHDDFDGDDSRATDAETVQHVIEQAARLVPATAGAYVIKTFAANRPASEERHRIRFDRLVPNLLHVHSRSAGISMSPMLGERVLQVLNGAGLDATERANPVVRLPSVPSLRGCARPEELVAANPLYGQVVCACENVSAAEIEAALTSHVPATSVDGVRKRTGAGYGRCQGSLCMAGVSFMTALRTGTGPADVRQTSRGTVGA